MTGSNEAWYAAAVADGAARPPRGPRPDRTIAAYTAD
jgi:hypothetical protein